MPCSRRGAFAGQLVATAGISLDEGIRPGGTLAKLATLKTPFKENGKTSVGNASQISNGAAALLHGWPTPAQTLH